MAETSPSLGEVGRSFMEAGRWGEALECFSEAKDMEGAAQLAAKALETGDLFFYGQAQRVLKHQPAAGELKELARNADAAGKAAFSATARNSISNGDDEP